MFGGRHLGGVRAQTHAAHILGYDPAIHLTTLIILGYDPAIHLTTLISDYYYQLFTGIELVPYQLLPYKLLLLLIIHEYALGSENIGLAY
jgi:hypothetical protein